MMKTSVSKECVPEHDKNDLWRDFLSERRKSSEFLLSSVCSLQTEESARFGRRRKISDEVLPMVRMLESKILSFTSSPTIERGRSVEFAKSRIASIASFNLYLLTKLFKPVSHKIGNTSPTKIAIVEQENLSSRLSSPHGYRRI